MTEASKTLVGRIADEILEFFGHSESDAAAIVDADAAKLAAEAATITVDVEAAFRPVVSETMTLGKDLLKVGVTAGLGALELSLGAKAAPLEILASVGTAIENSIKTAAPADGQSLTATALAGLAALVTAHGIPAITTSPPTPQGVNE